MSNEELQRGSRSRPDYQSIVEAAAWMQMAVPQLGRSHRFVRPTENRRGLVVLIDGVPSPSRPLLWERVIEAVSARGYRIAARTSLPKAGAEDGRIEAVAFFADNPDIELELLVLWAEAHRALGGS